MARIGGAQVWRLRCLRKGQAAVVAIVTAGSVVMCLPASTEAATRQVRRPASLTPVRNADLSPRPGDPPIGVPVQTLDTDYRVGTIVIDGVHLPGTEGYVGIHFALIDAADRKVLDSGTKPRSAAGITELVNMAIANKGKDRIMIVTSPDGVYPADVPMLNVLATNLGSPGFTQAELIRLGATESGGMPFSILGIPGSPKGSAWTTVEKVTPDYLLRGSNITGYLQFNYPAGLYNFVPGRDVTFSTSAPGAPPGGNVIEVGGSSYPGQLPAGASSGFEILGLDPQTLEKRYLETVATDTAAGAAQLNADLLTARYDYYRGPENPPSLVFVQSIGRPLPGLGGWTDVSGVIKQLGGNQLAFLDLDGKSSYSLVGSTDTGMATVEAGDVLGKPGPLAGVLEMSHVGEFQPVAAGPAGGMNLQLLNLEYQRPQAWPSISGAAETWIGREVRLCGQTATVCNFRQMYGSNYLQDWNRIHADINDPNVTVYPGDGHGFTLEEFNAAKRELATETSYLLQVKNYFTVVQDAFGKSAGDRRVDVGELGTAITQAVDPPRADNGLSFGLGLVGKLALIGTAAPPPASSIAAGIAALFAIASYLTNKSGQPLLASEVQVQAGKLAEYEQAVLSDVVDSFTTQARIIVTDWGKLQKADSFIADKTWELPQDFKEYVPALQLAVKRWFAEALVPVAFKWLIRGTPPPVGPGDGNGLSCDVYAGNWPFPDKKVGTSHPWRALPKNAQIRAIEGWNGDGTPVKPSYFFSREHPLITAIEESRQDRNVIPQSLADTLFNTTSGSLGINLFEFLSPRYFGSIHNANDASRNCGLY
jgi:hypothetical protein